MPIEEETLPWQPAGEQASITADPADEVRRLNHDEYVEDGCSLTQPQRAGDSGQAWRTSSNFLERD